MTDITTVVYTALIVFGIIGLAEVAIAWYDIQGRYKTDDEIQEQTDRQTCVDGTINKPQQREVANCITARYDCGISNLRSDGNLVAENKCNA